MDLRFPKPEKRVKAKRPLKRGTRPRRQRKGAPSRIRRECDRLWSLIVRARGACESPRVHVCRGVYQAAHGLGRSYWNTRWLPINGFKLCQGEHVYFTHRPIQWRLFLVEAWGPGVYETLERLALRAAKPDADEALAKLLAEAEQYGIGGRK